MMRSVLAAAVLVGTIAACAVQPEEEAIPYCASYIPAGTPCIEPVSDRERPEGVEEPVIVEEPAETDYEGPRVRE